MTNKIEYVELQKVIKDYFKDAKVKKFKNSLSKDPNGYNWVITFHELRTDSALICYTKFIFKLDKDKKYVRKTEFLYLRDLPNKYRIVKYNDLNDIKKILDDILTQNMFGEYTTEISEFLSEPERHINNYFSSKEIFEYSVFDFQYIPNEKDKSFVMYFKMNINNNIDVDVKLTISDKIDLTFKHADKYKKVSCIPSDIVEVFANYIQEL